jgi:hypothetical protein
MNIPNTHTILTTHTCRSTVKGKFFGKVIARRPTSRGGLVVWCETFNTRAAAMRAARKQVANH